MPPAFLLTHQNDVAMPAFGAMFACNSPYKHVASSISLGLCLHIGPNSHPNTLLFDNKRDWKEVLDAQPCCVVSTHNLGAQMLIKSGSLDVIQSLTSISGLAC